MERSEVMLKVVEYVGSLMDEIKEKEAKNKKYEVDKMGGTVLKFANDAQYQKFINDIKESVVKEIKENAIEEKRNGWNVVKKEYTNELSVRYRKRLADKTQCDLPSRQAFFEIAKCAFGATDMHVSILNVIPESELRTFKNELIELIEKYHAKHGN